MENFLEKQISDEVLIEDAYLKAISLLSRDEIKISSFEDLYGKPRIEEDEAKVRRLEDAMKEGEIPESRRMKQLASVLEAIIHEQGELANWFGEDAFTIKTSRYDDIVNGVDEVVQFLESGSFSFLALGIDVTFSKNLEKKLQRVKKEILNGELATVQYFEDEENNIRRELKRIPRLVISIDYETVLELAELWLAGKSGALAAHDVQCQILEEIEKQCDLFAAFARRHGKNEVAEKYDHTADVIADIQMKKADTRQNSGKRDKAYHELMRGLGPVFGEKQD